MHCCDDKHGGERKVTDLLWELGYGARDILHHYFMTIMMLVGMGAALLGLYGVEKGK